MKRVSVFLVSVVLAACGSSEKKTEAEPAPDVAPLTGSAPDHGTPSVTTETPATVEKPVETVKHETPSGAYAPLSEAYRAQSDEGIYRAASQILSQNPNDAKALNAMGLYHYRKGRFGAARAFFSRALAQSPRSGELHNNLGLIMAAQGEQREAIRSFKKALDLNPSDGLAAANVGSIYVQEKDYVKAQIALEIAVKKGMREPRTLNNYGIALVGVGKYDQAKRVYEDALNLASNNKEALFNLAILQIEQMKQYSEGLEHLNRLRFLGPDEDMRNTMNALENKAKAGIK